MKKYSLGALVAAGLLAGGLTAGSASAADLGGNCCADLEERIAELEATTARKGNRKVSLTVSGWVAQQVMAWDDGYESNVYVSDIGTTLATHFKFTGQATISPGWYAGYVLHIEAHGPDALGVTQNNDEGALVPGLSTLQSFWFIKSDHLGKLSVGRQSQASDNTAILVDGSGSLVPANWVAFDYFGFLIRRSDTASTAGLPQYGLIGKCVGGGTVGDCNGYTTDSIRYDTPTFGGFSASASWGEDDMWDVALRYAGEHAGFKFAAAAAYSEVSDLGSTAPAGSIASLFAQNDTVKYFQVGAYLEHVPTGLFLYGAYGNQEADIATGDAINYYVKGGLRERWHPLGHTVLYGEYQKNEADGFFGAQPTGPGGLTSTSTDLDLWGLGVVQEIDAAAMSLWVSYRHIEYDDSTALSYEDFDYIKAGALINF